MNLTIGDSVKKSVCRHRLSSTILSVLIAGVCTGLSGCAVDDNTNVSTPPANVAGTTPTDSSGRQRVAGNTSFSVDTVNHESLPKGNTVVVDSATTPNIIVFGWAVDGKSQNVAGGVIINIDGKTDMPASYGAERPDVATVLKNPNYRQSGFGIAIPVSKIGKGPHTLSLKILTTDQRGYYEPAQKIAVDVK